MKSSVYIPMSLFKYCLDCKETKSVEMFNRESKAKGGRQFPFKIFHPSAVKKGRKENPDESLAYKRRWYLKDSYGITIEEYVSMFNAQNGCCAICDKQTALNAKGSARLAVDHSHKTGKVRGLLCMECNQALGKFKDSTEILRKALGYLGGIG